MSNKKNKKNMKEKHLPVGIFNNEIFIARVEDGKFKGFDGVLRPVTTEQLNYLRDSSERREEYKDLWKEAVKEGVTEEGLDDWLESVWAEDFDEDDPEDYPGKDESDMEYLSDEDRLKADCFLSLYGVKVGTWESSGSYSPRSFYKDFKRFDYVFMNPDAERIAKEYEGMKD